MLNKVGRSILRIFTFILWNSVLIVQFWYSILSLLDFACPLDIYSPSSGFHQHCTVFHPSSNSGFFGNLLPTPRWNWGRGCFWKAHLAKPKISSEGTICSGLPILKVFAYNSSIFWNWGLLRVPEKLIFLLLIWQKIKNLTRWYAA